MTTSHSSVFLNNSFIVHHGGVNVNCNDQIVHSSLPLSSSSSSPLSSSLLPPSSFVVCVGNRKIELVVLVEVETRIALNNDDVAFAVDFDDDDCVVVGGVGVDVDVRLASGTLDDAVRNEEGDVEASRRLQLRTELDPLAGEDWGKWTSASYNFRAV